MWMRKDGLLGSQECLLLFRCPCLHRGRRCLQLDIRLSIPQRSLYRYLQYGSGEERHPVRCAWQGDFRIQQPCILSDNRSMQEPITRDPELMHGTPVFRGTRVPVKTMFEYLENGESLDDFLEGSPTVSRELAVQVLEESKELRLARVS